MPWSNVSVQRNYGLYILCLDCDWLRFAKAWDLIIMDPSHPVQFQRLLMGFPDVVSSNVLLTSVWDALVKVNRGPVL
jgi:hypothetical protein